MGREWSLEPIDPARPEELAGEAFVPRFPPPGLDLILVGRDEGPVGQLVASGERWPGFDGPPEECPSALIPSPAVRRCAAGLSGLSQSTYAPPDVALTGIVHERLPWLERALYDDLAAEADALRQFIARSADLGLALRCWMH